jgi:hypothetical protein
MRNPDGDADPDSASPARDWSRLDAYGDAGQRWRRYSLRMRHPPALRRTPVAPRFTMGTLFHLLLIVGLGALMVLIIIAGTPRTHHWAGPKQLQTEASTGERSWIGR